VTIQLGVVVEVVVVIEAVGAAGRCLVNKEGRKKFLWEDFVVVRSRQHYSGLLK
jgi:hypothetical protein